MSKYIVLPNIIPNASAVVFRRELMGGLPKAPEQMRLCGDWLFWSQLTTRGDVCFLAEPLNFWRGTHEDNHRSKTAPQALEVLEGLEVFKIISEHVELEPGTRKRVLRQQIKVRCAAKPFLLLLI